MNHVRVAFCCGFAAACLVLAQVILLQFHSPSAVHELQIARNRSSSGRTTDSAECADVLAALGRPSVLPLGEWVVRKTSEEERQPGEPGFNMDVWRIVSEQGSATVVPDLLSRRVPLPSFDELHVAEVHLPVGGVPYAKSSMVNGTLSVVIRVTARAANGVSDLAGQRWRLAGGYAHDGAALRVDCKLADAVSVSRGAVLDILCVLRPPRAATILSFRIEGSEGRSDRESPDEPAAPLRSPLVAVSLRPDPAAWSSSRGSFSLVSLVRQRGVSISGDWRPDRGCELDCRRATGTASDQVVDAHVMSVAGAFRPVPVHVKTGRIPVILVVDECSLHAEFKRFGSAEFLRSLGVRWLAGYQLDSGIPTFGNTRRGPTPLSQLRRQLSVRGFGLRKPRAPRSTVAFVSSTCRPVRTNIVAELMQHISVDSHGKCLRNVGMSNQTDLDGVAGRSPRKKQSVVTGAVNFKSRVQSQYPFCVAIDNCVEQDYIMQVELLFCLVFLGGWLSSASALITIRWLTPEIQSGQTV
jgi:hypothetical protein